jgi:hypothetical protein
MLSFIRKDLNDGMQARCASLLATISIICFKQAAFANLEDR